MNYVKVNEEYDTNLYEIFYLKEQQHDIEKGFDVVPIQVSGTRPHQQFLRHVGRSASPLLRGPGIVVLEVLPPG